MNDLSKKFATAVVSAAVVLTSFVPAQAIQMPAAPPMKKISDMQNVEYGDRSEYRRRHYRRYDDDRHYRSHRRERYRERYVYPLAAFGAGAIIGGAIASQQRSGEQPQNYSGSSNHVSWCASRYRSYQAYDNTFQPYSGPRQPCYSPYN